MSRRRVCIAVLLVLAIVGALVAASAAAPRDVAHRFRGAEGVVVRTSDAEPTWWLDPIVEPPPGGDEARVELVVPGDALFATDSATITPNSAQGLDDAIHALGLITVERGTVRCHTDDGGSDEYNMDLSNRRAGAVVDELDRLGLDRAAIAPSGAGESEPRYDNTTETGRARNRRCEIQLVIVR